MNTSVYIDDTGTSGLTSASKFSSPEAKSWYAVILKPSDRVIASNFMSDCLKDLKKGYNANEFHFKDIYNGKNEFKDIPLDVRLNIFWEFADLFQKYNFPILCQTFSPEEYERNKLIKRTEMQAIDNFNFNKHGDFGLYHLMMLIRIHIVDARLYPRPFEIIIDQDGKKVNVSRTVNLFGDDLLNRQIQYKSSADTPLIQLADFAAYCLNRLKWILQNNSQYEKKLDMTFWEICTYANFNTLNMIKEITPMGENVSLKYDDKLQKAYNKNSFLSEIDTKTYKEELREKNNSAT